MGRKKLSIAALFFLIFHYTQCLDQLKSDVEERLAGGDTIQSICDELRDDFSLDFVNTLLPECGDDQEVKETEEDSIKIPLACEEEEDQDENEEDVKGSCSAVQPRRELNSNAEKSLLDLNQAIRLNKSNAQAYESRAKVLLGLGRLEEALKDFKKAIKLHPTPERLNDRGGLHIKLQKYQEAYSDFESSLKLLPNQPDVYHLKGLALYNQGRMKESVVDYTDALKLRPGAIIFLRSLGQSYRELGDLDDALKAFNRALAEQPLDPDSLYLRGSLYHYSGRQFEALSDFKGCVALEPVESVICQYGLAQAHGTLGEYYQPVKITTAILIAALQRPPTSRWVDRDTLIRMPYIKEYFRYLHSCLDKPVAECRAHVDFSEVFQEGWAKALTPDFLLWQDHNQRVALSPYTEQPGLSPDISDVQRYDLEELPEDARTLIRVASTLGALTRYRGSKGGDRPHHREVLAYGLLALEVAQRSHAYWDQHLNRQRLTKEKRVGWRNLFRTGLAWMRLVEVDQPMLWLDMLISEAPSHGFNHHNYLKRGQVFNYQYQHYYQVLFNITKRTIIENRGGQSPSEREVERQVGASMSPEELLATMRRLGLPQGPGFLVSLKVPCVSKKPHKKHLDGLVFTITLEENESVAFSVDTSTADVFRTKLYHRELDFVWTALEEEFRKAHLTKDGLDHEAVINLILSLGYYFYNLMPISRHYSLVGYSVMMGLLLSIGRQVTGQLPPGKLVDLEFMLSGSPDAMIALARSWMKLHRKEIDVLHLPRVTETFPTLRTMIEALNTASTPPTS